MSQAPRSVAAVVLAAGASTRLGRPKQLVEYDGESLLRRAARAAIEVGAAPVFVVVGAHEALVRPALDGLAAVTIVPNEAWAAGLASSLAVGVRAALAEPSIEGVLVMLADQPLVDAAALRRLLAAWPEARGVVAAAYADTLGVPAVFARRHAESLLALTGDVGAGRWLRTRRHDVVAVPMDDAAVDVDTPDDAARLPR